MCVQDQFDCIDLSDNVLAVIGNFPPLLRLRSLLVSGNVVSRVEEGMGERLPALEMLILTGNRVTSLKSVLALSELRTLKVLSLLHNPVARKEHYRLFVVHHLPALTTLDFSRVTDEERSQAAKLFSSAKGRRVVEDVRAEEEARETRPTLTREQADRLRAAIEAATSREELKRLEDCLESGVMPPGLE
jgi:U2 small nuclear ribonucleoprotein A'